MNNPDLVGRLALSGVLKAGLDMVNELPSAWDVHGLFERLVVATEQIAEDR